MAICRWCEGEMIEVVGCNTGTFNFKDNPLVPRIPFGMEEFLDGQLRCSVEQCHECLVLTGHFHHPGCNTEECPVCGKQVMACNCEMV